MRRQPARTVEPSREAAARSRSWPKLTPDFGGGWKGREALWRDVTAQISNVTVHSAAHTQHRGISKRKFALCVEVITAAPLGRPVMASHVWAIRELPRQRSCIAAAASRARRLARRLRRRNA